MQSEPSSNPLPARRWLDYRRKRFWGVAALLLYVLGGFFVLPPILKARIVAVAQKSLDRPVTLEGVGVNPLLLSVDLRGLRVTEKDGAPLLGFDRLHVRLALDSLLHRAWSFGDISLEGFKGDIVRFGASDTDIGRLIPPSTPSQDAPQPIPRLLIHHLHLKNAEASFTDHVPATPFTTRIGPVNADIDQVGTLPDETGRLHITAGLEKGATLDWTGQGSLEPLSSTGHIMAKGAYVPLLARYFGDTYKLSVPSGTLGADLDYTVKERPDGSLGGTVDHLAVALDDLKAQENGASEPFLTLPHLHLTGGHLAWPEREASAEAFSLDGLDLSLRREPDGSIAPLPVGAPQPAPSPDKEKKDWSFSLGKVEIKDGKAQFEDRSLPMGGKIGIAPIGLTAESLSSKPDAVFPFSLSLGLPPSGTVKLQGKATVSPNVGVDAKLTIADVPVLAGQAYLHDLAKLWIEDGKLDAEGDVKLTKPDGLRISGKGDVRELKLKDEVEQTPVVTWEHLGIDHYSYHQDANELRIAQVTLDQPYLRFQIAADRSTNFSHIVVPAAPGKTTAEAEQAAAPMKVSVGRVNVAKGKADYGDASLPLPFLAHITNLGGHVAALASNSSSPPSVTLKGQVDPYGEADVYGHVNPFKPTKGLDMNVVFHNVAFPTLSPYTAKFAGWRVAKGSLDVESHYQIDGTKLAGKNKVVIRDMQLGEKMDVPGALDLPLDLLVSLLKDDQGKIAIDIPITGDVSDPQFDFGAVVMREVGDLLGNILASPFRALAGLFGGDGEQLDHIDFPAGRADLEPPEKEKLQHVAELMRKKPKIDLVVAGVVDKQVDRRKLQHDAIDAEMAKDLGDHATVSRQRRFLEAQFEQRVGKDKLAAVKQPFVQNGDDDPGYIAALRREVAKTETVDDAGLDKLAQSRGKAVADALRQIPGFDANRVQVKGIQAAKSDDNYHVPMKLEAAEAGGK